MGLLIRVHEQRLLGEPQDQLDVIVLVLRFHEVHRSPDRLVEIDFPR